MTRGCLVVVLSAKIDVFILFLYTIYSKGRFMLKKRVAILIFMPFLLFAKFNPNDWDDKDKPYFLQRDNISHFIINGVISGSVGYLAKEAGFSKSESVFIGMATGLVFGILKENLYDKNYSISDMQSWGIGAMIGAISVSFSF
jgi:hypothetical protein